MLTIFRLFVGVQLILMLVNLHVHSARGYLGSDTTLAFSYLVGGTLILMGYLCLPLLERKLGRLYLPIALVYSTIFSLFAQYMFLTNPAGGGSEESAWQLFLFLCVPLVLVSWQYGFRSVVIYCFFITILDLVLARLAKTDFASFEFTYERLALIRFMSFLIVGYVVARIMQQLRRQRQALQEANDKLGAYLSTLEELTVSRERNRMARELHDTLAHTLSGMAVQLEAVDSLWVTDRKEAHKLLQHSLQAARAGLTETRQAIQALRATPLEDLGLPNSIREYAGTAASRTGFKLELDLPDEFESYPPEVERCFYRILQEAVENIVRHAEAKAVRVGLARTGQGLCLEIEDDGIGFDPAVAESGQCFGLKGMRERAQLIGACLDIISAARNGTRVRLIWQAVQRQERDER